MSEEQYGTFLDLAKEARIYISQMTDDLVWKYCDFNRLECYKWLVFFPQNPFSFLPESIAAQSEWTLLSLLIAMCGRVV